MWRQREVKSRKLPTESNDEPYVGESVIILSSWDFYAGTVNAALPQPGGLTT